VLHYIQNVRKLKQKINNTNNMIMLISIANVGLLTCKLVITSNLPPINYWYLEDNIFKILSKSILHNIPCGMHAPRVICATCVNFLFVI